MGTKQDCRRGEHTSDDQGLCWWCGCVVNQEWWDAYCGADDDQVSEDEE